MLLIVGLGNPDAKYHGNRHNIGFQILDAIASRYGFDAEKVKFQARVREGFLDGHGARAKALLLQPTTYYNESGRAVREAAQFYKIPINKIIVFHDELDLAPAKLKVKQGGGAAGNNGLRSITSHLGENFQRVRIGIGHPGDKAKVTKYVLSDFSKAERSDWVEDMLDACAEATPLFASVEDGDAKFMSRVALKMNPPTHTVAPTSKQPTAQNTTHQTTKTNATDAQKENKGPFSALCDLFGSKD